MNRAFKVRPEGSGIGEKIIGYPVNKAFGFRKSESIGPAVGIELEMEGENFPRNFPVDAVWRYEKDHSLRGEDNAEYVLNAPIALEHVSNACEYLFDYLSSNDVVIDESNRTSTHVHFNFLDQYPENVASFSALFFCFEEVLANYCGEHRVGNLFCLRAIDAPAIVTMTKNLVKNSFSYPMDDHYRYAGCNLASLGKYGSIEIRTMRGVDRAEDVIEWVSILEKFYKFALDCKDPRVICQQFSAEGPSVFFDRILGDMAGIVRLKTGMMNEEINSSMYRGIRMAQDICYAIDWDNYVHWEPDPFGRSKENAKKKPTNFIAYTETLVGGMPVYEVNAEEFAELWAPSPTSSPSNPVEEEEEIY